MGRFKDKPSTRKSPLRRSPRKHSSEEPKTATKKAKAAVEPDLGTIPWAYNEGALIWLLLDQLQVPDNRLVLFGKKPGTTENTKGDSKIIVYKRIGEVILSELYKTSPNTLGKRVKAKAEDLVKSYKTHAKKLQVTGGGLQNDQDEDNDGDNVHEFLKCYISPEGPDHDTSKCAKNLWGISQLVVPPCHL
ncbi:hypothetical protein DFH07DRAFT_792485 [Mycena maculata]|uniref:Uncharacterized protein n=1 Tax=Mycena maculata TaxID=230809 RepID=A0AAD7NYK6_9AGAR|nr:hypothetical protein DFH07DRAFT_792485 [Mycena maculata]